MMVTIHIKNEHESCTTSVRPSGACVPNAESILANMASQHKSEREEETDFD